MTEAWSFYVSTNQFLTELRGLTRNYPFCGDILTDAQIRVRNKSESNRSWNMAWLCLQTIVHEAWKMADRQSVFWPSASRDSTRRPFTVTALGISKTTDHDPDKSASLPAILAALVPSLISAVVLLAIFLVVKKPFRRIYSPRTYMDVIPEKDRTPESSLKPFEWFRTFRQLDDKFVLEHSSLDAYLYLRFLKTIVLVCSVGVCITWPILMPVVATGGGDASQLDRLGFGNVRRKDRLYAHAVVAWLFFGFVMVLVARERMWLIGLRQAWYLARANASRLSSRTVLYLDPPTDASSDDDPRSNFGDDARHRWVVTKTKPIDDAVANRDAKLLELEFAEVAFLKQASEKITKTRKREGLGADDASYDETEPGVLESARPRERQYYLSGDAAQLIDHLRGDVKEAEQKVTEKQESYSAERTDGHGRCAIFVEYIDQAAAQRAYRSESKLHLPVPPGTAVRSRLIGVVPKEIIWGNLAMPQAERLSKQSVANILIVLLIVFWSIPTAIIGTISNVTYLANNVSWLAWIKDLPDPILGLLTGFVPPLLTSQLASYLPNIMRYVAKASGQPTTVSAELQVQAWYYAFQVVQVFLVTALSSSATAFVPKIINEPHHIPRLLADNLPTSSNFYLTYFIIQGLGSSVKNIMNWSDLLQYIFYEIFIYKTPRDKYKQYTSLKGIAWGKVYPKFTNFAVIALAYSCISPLVLGFAAVGLSLFYLSYKYTLLFMVVPKIETRGKCYTRALQQLLAGVYIGELCLVGLFGLRNAKGPSIMLVVLLLATVTYHLLINRYLNPLEDHFPEEVLSADDGDGEQSPLLAAAEEGQLAEHQRLLVQRRAHIPQEIFPHLARFLEPSVYASHKAMSAFLARTTAETDPPPSYSEEDIKKAYQNPSLTSKTPVLWLPRDIYGLSKKEIESLAKAGFDAVDDGAWVNENGKVDFERRDLRHLPIWKEGKTY
ncbi:phosphate metabolism protein 7 [Cytospora paraplurivora]|uniref:Phosphate metabolism protein 7 n=1 Tax=Cytospora paraplurivora TaxID=2898453 RepID=A0AAN9YB64_9PEZI